jgi:hypothetical protein
MSTFIALPQPKNAAKAEYLSLERLLALAIAYARQVAPSANKVYVEFRRFGMVYQILIRQGQLYLPCEKESAQAVAELLGRLITVDEVMLLNPQRKAVDLDGIDIKRLLPRPVAKRASAEVIHLPAPRPVEAQEHRQAA